VRVAPNKKLPEGGFSIQPDDCRSGGVDARFDLRRDDAEQQYGYFNELLTELNMVLRLLPSPLTAARIAIEMPAAISPYSMAVAPLSSARNFAKIRFTFCPPAFDHFKG